MTIDMELLSAALRVNKSLHRLKLWYTDTGAQHFTTMLRANTTLQVLELSLLEITNTGILHLLEALKHNSGLNKLKLWSNKCITDTEAQHLATMLSVKTTLERLELSLQITHAGIIHLSEALKRNNNLKKLSLRYNEHITSTGAVALSEMLLVNKSLENLDLFDTSVGEEGAAALMESLLHNQVLTELRLPIQLETYCEQHVLYDRVKDRIRW